MSEHRTARPDQVDDGRRTFLGTLACGSAGLALQLSAVTQAGSAPAQESLPGEQAVAFEVNGSEHRLRVDPRVTLLDALREHLHLTGAKKGCDRGQCGACTVLVNGRRINSCLTLALMHAGDEITTVEGLAKGGAPSALQAAFLEHDAYQCGFCTPGQLCSATALLDELRANRASVVTPALSSPQPVRASDTEIRERMSGNICRCGAYTNIVAAVRAALGHEDADAAVRL
jgi:xanthine dehydrogenase YagT iron-sulfur-binding subunit